MLLYLFLKNNLLHIEEKKLTSKYLYFDAQTKNEYGIIQDIIKIIDGLYILDPIFPFGKKLLGYSYVERNNNSKFTVRGGYDYFNFNINGAENEVDKKNFEYSSKNFKKFIIDIIDAVNFFVKFFNLADIKININEYEKMGIGEQINTVIKNFNQQINIFHTKYQKLLQFSDNISFDEIIDNENIRKDFMILYLHVSDLVELINNNPLVFPQTNYMFALFSQKYNMPHFDNTKVSKILNNLEIVLLVRKKRSS